MSRTAAQGRAAEPSVPRGVAFVVPIVEYGGRHYFVLRPYERADRYFLEAPVVERDGRLYVSLYNDRGARRLVHVPRSFIKSIYTLHAGNFVPWNFANGLPAILIGFRDENGRTVEEYYLPIEAEYDGEEGDFRVRLRPGLPSAAPVPVSLGLMAGRFFVVRPVQLPTDRSNLYAGLSVIFGIPAAVLGILLALAGLIILGGATVGPGFVPFLMALIVGFAVSLPVATISRLMIKRARLTVPYVYENEEYVEDYSPSYVEPLA